MDAKEAHLVVAQFRQKFPEDGLALMGIALGQLKDKSPEYAEGYANALLWCADRLRGTARDLGDVPGLDEDRQDVAIHTLTATADYVYLSGAVAMSFADFLLRLIEGACEGVDNE